MAASNVPGGSTFAMVESIVGGHLLVTERTFARLRSSELDQLTFEIEKRLRALRGSSPDLEDQPALQARNRRLQRLNTARAMLAAFRRQRKA